MHIQLKNFIRNNENTARESHEHENGIWSGRNKLNEEKQERYDNLWIDSAGSCIRK